MKTEGLPAYSTREPRSNGLLTLPVLPLCVCVCVCPFLSPHLVAVFIHCPPTGPCASNGEGSPLEREKTPVVTAVNASTINAPTSRAKPLAVRLKGVSQKLGKFAEGGGMTLRMWAGQSLEMGKRGAVWLQERYTMV